MKKLLSFNSLLLLAGVCLIGCKQEPLSTDGQTASQQLTAGGGSTAHPAWTFKHQATVQNQLRYSIAVSDSDGTDVANVYVSSDYSAHQDRFPTWSPTGSSISFVEGPTPTGNWYSGSVWGACSIKAVDVSVSHGVASGSNVRTICSYTTADSVKIIVQAWCPVSSVGKIAFLGITPTEYAIYTVSSSGGTPTKIYSVNASSAVLSPGPLDGGSLTWSNGGTKIAFVERSSLSTPDTALNYKIRVVDATGAVQVTLDSCAHTLGGLKWSHSGLNKISYYRTPQLNASTISDYDLYTIGTSAGSTPTLLRAQAISAFWSPNNSELVCQDRSGTTTVTKIGASNGSTIGTVFIPVTDYGDWKQP